MRSLLHVLLAISLLAVAGVAAAQDADPYAPASNAATAATAAGQATPPPNYTAPALPQADESNAERARSQPGNNAPFWRGVRNSGEQPGVSSLPGAEKGVLVQQFVQYPGSSFTTAGEAWRQVRNQWILPYGGAIIVIAIVALAIFFFTRGPIGERIERGGERRIERFTPFERAAHWTNAVAFVVLAVSGLVMAFGRVLMLPWMGGTLFGWLTYALKTIHNFVGPLFVVSLAVVFFTFLRSNWPRREDVEWLKRGGGLVGDHEVPSHRFNAGEKVIFWGGVLTLGVIVVVSGLFLDMLLPGFEYTRGEMQIAHMVHGVATLLMIAMFLGHIYLGTIGMRGAYTAMRTGYVSEAWADEHHKLWADDIRAGKIPVRRSRSASQAAGRPAGSQA